MEGEFKGKRERLLVFLGSRRVVREAASAPSTLVHVCVDVFVPLPVCAVQAFPLREIEACQQHRTQFIHNWAQSNLLDRRWSSVQVTTSHHTQEMLCLYRNVNGQST